MTHAEARDRALAELRSRAPIQPDDEVVILDDDTLERDWGWVFFYDSRRWRESRDKRYALRGNGPLIVNKLDGTVHLYGTGQPSEYYIHAYETEFLRDRAGWCVVITHVPTPTPDVLQALRATLELRPGEVQELQRRTPAVIPTGERPEAVRICEELRSVGIGAEPRRR